MLFICGIGSEASFDIDFVKKYPNIPSYAFDGTLNIAPLMYMPSDFPKEIIFINKLIYTKNGKNIMSYSSSGLHTIECETTNLIEEVKPYNDVFLKMDIEGEEWQWIKIFENYFPKIKQFVFEAHALFTHKIGDYLINAHCTLPLDQWIQNILESLKILNKTHYLVHMHENNSTPYININGHNYASFMELTYIRKDCEIDGLNKDILPINIDACTSSIHLSNNINFWPFKHD